ncbi:hypothetical protein FZEAL_2163 [Fusarium zealandicum]|uniref:Uncharacterized protein n=1 Tax=Fusarium zealandicum TaxID=1053134 RepID=A0A8H4URH0_9HYPO|nr:hypothetical protein FZEAL_2163 [Fusarium zealandicum]
MSSLPSSSNAGKKGPIPSQDFQDSGLDSPMSRWLHQGDRDEPWRGFTVSSSERKHGKSNNNRTPETNSQPWSMEAKVGSTTQG